MSNRLLREPDVIKAILENKEMFRTDRDIQRFAVVIGDIPAVDVELNFKLAYERGKREALEQIEPQTKECCDTCRNWDIVNDHCYFIQECHYQPKDEPQTCSFSDCDNFKNPDYERCIECKRKQIKLKTEQTERSSE